MQFWIKLREAQQLKKQKNNKKIQSYVNKFDNNFIGINFLYTAITYL